MYILYFVLLLRLFYEVRKVNACKTTPISLVFRYLVTTAKLISKNV